MWRWFELVVIWRESPKGRCEFRLVVVHALARTREFAMQLPKAEDVPALAALRRARARQLEAAASSVVEALRPDDAPVSYTHLTLPTIPLV